MQKRRNEAVVMACCEVHYTLRKFVKHPRFESRMGIFLLGFVLQTWSIWLTKCFFSLPLLSILRQERGQKNLCTKEYPLSSPPFTLASRVRCSLFVCVGDNKDHHHLTHRKESLVDLVQHPRRSVKKLLDEIKSCIKPRKPSK